MTGDAILLLAPGIPLMGALLIALSNRHPNVREAITVTTAGLLLCVILSLLPAPSASGGPGRGVVVAEPLPGLTIALATEPLGFLFAIIASFLWILTSIYSIGYMRAHHETNQTRFYVFFAVAISATMGIAFSANMLTLFVCYEILTLSTYPLVTHARTPEAKRAGRLYLGILLTTSIGFQLFAIIWTWALAGTLDFTPNGILAGTASPTVLSLLLLLYVFGIGKAALMPFHRWLPAAMVAPTPVSAFLHAVAVVKAGVFTILKVCVYVFGLDLLSELDARQWLLYVAGVTILLASTVALTKDNLKARLAYSTISQLSYVIIGGLLANAWGLLGGGLHLAMHAFGKITLFFCAGAIMVAAHKTDISQMDGLGRTMPITMGAFLIGSLSIIGLPPFGGMWSKWFLALGTIDASQQFLLMVLMLSTLLNVAYLLPIPVRAFFYPPASPAPGGMHEAPLPCLIALVLSAAGCFWLFLQPTLVAQFLEPLLP